MIRLRKIEPTDLPFLYQWENDSAAWADGANHNPLSQHDLRDYIAASTGDIYKDGQLRLIAEFLSQTPSVGDSQRSGTETIGCIDLFDLDPRNRRAAIGMYVAPDFRGKGLGQAMVVALEDYAFTFLHLRLLYAVIGTMNEPCSHLYRSMGYQPSAPLPAWTLESDAVLWTKTNPHG